MPETDTPTPDALELARSALHQSETILGGTRKQISELKRALQRVTSKVESNGYAIGRLQALVVKPLDSFECGQAREAKGARAERERLMPWIDHIKACPHSPELHGEDSDRDCSCGLTAALDAAPEATELTCPEDCPRCSGEYCDQHFADACDCDVVARHTPVDVAPEGDSHGR